MVLNIQVVLLITIINSYYIMLDSQLILKKFTLLINSFGFKTPKRFWHKNMVSFIKRLDDIHYCYIIIDAYKNNPVEVFRINLWVGPICFPDDSLSSLSANIKLEISKANTMTDIFLEASEKKIRNLIETDVVNTLINFSKREIDSPSIKNHRYEVYTKYLLPFFLNTIRKADGNVFSIKNKNIREEIIKDLEKFFFNLFNYANNIKINKSVVNVCFQKKFLRYIEKYKIIENFQS